MCLIACGNWNNATNAGPGARNCNNSRANSNNNVSFRADSVPPQTLSVQNSRVDIGAKGDAFRP